MSNIDNIIEGLKQNISATESEKDRTERMARLEELMAAYEGEDKIVTSHDIAERLKDDGKKATHSTGVSSLDELLRGGFRGGQMVVIAAMTKHGKTEFCTFLTEKMKELNPVWFSYEDGADELVERFLDRGADVPLFYTPALLGQRSTEWIEKKIVEAKVKYGSKLVFVDNLQYLVPRGQNHSVEVGFITKELKDMATRWDVTIVLVAHLMKNAQLDRSPTLTDIRDSSFIAQDASTVIFLWRRTVIDQGIVTVTDDVLLSVQAARRGKPGNIKMHFNGDTYYEYNWDDSTSTERKFNAT